MNPELLAAYHYLSSAIAQAFAALIALTAMFYIYRIGRLKSEKKSIADNLRSIYGFEKSHGNSNLLTAALELVKSYSDEDLIKQMTIAFSKDRTLPFNIYAKIGEWLVAQSLYLKLKKKPLLPIVLSSLTMSIAIIFLLIGSIIPSSTYRWLAMCFETVLALVSLSITVIVVKSMLEEPNASKIVNDLFEELKKQSREKKVESSKPVEPQTEEGQE
jgi:uncharacterized protein (UPF0335 family)